MFRRAVLLLAVTTLGSALSLGAATINEIRTDGDPSVEFFELHGTPGESLHTLTYLVIGDGSGGSGVIEEVTSLSGLSIPGGDSFFLAGEDPTTCGEPVDLDTSLSFENSDNLTHLLVVNFSGSSGDDLDTNDDCVLDVTPWDSIVDGLAMIEEDNPPTGTECHYGTDLGLPVIGPDSGDVPFHVSRKPDGSGDWESQSTEASCTGEDTPGMTNVPDAGAKEIWEIQGSASSTMYNGHLVTTSGNIVTALDSEGFCMQTTDVMSDGDAQTSDGIYVFTGGAPGVTVGDMVDVDATISEFFGFTELTLVTDLSVSASGQPLPSAIAFDASTPSPDPTSPSCNTGDLECFEGMLITVADAVVGQGNLSFGVDPIAEVTISAGGQRALREKGIEYPGGGGDIPTWDGNPEIFELDPNRLGLPNELLFGGTSLSATGCLGYEFGDFELWPTSLDLPLERGSAQPVRPAAAGELTVASFNVFRLYDNINDDPSMNSQGGTRDDDVLTTSEWMRRRDKVVLYILDVLRAPDVVGIQEVESQLVLEAVAAEIAVLDPSSTYSAHVVEGNDVGTIDVGFLVKEATVDVDSLTQLGVEETLTFDGSLLHDRPPLLLEATFTADAASFPFAVMVNHTRSLIGIEDGDGRVRQKRLEQAQSIAQKAQDFQSANPTTPIILIGDFNAYQFTDGYVDVIGQIRGKVDPSENTLSAPTITNPRFVDQVLRLPLDQRYSFVFEGNAQALDHALTSTNTELYVSGFEYGRGNADAPRILIDDSAIPERSSDHDGFVIYLDTTVSSEIFADGFESGDTSLWN